MDHEKLTDLVMSTLDDLVAKELIAADSMSTHEATGLGKAIVTPSEEGIFHSQRNEESSAGFRNGWRDAFPLYVHTNSVAAGLYCCCE
jgi:hypothetical protein